MAGTDSTGGGSREAGRPGDGSRASTDRRDDPDAQGSENAVVRWVLVDGNRSVIIALLSLISFVVFVVLGLAEVISVTDSALVSSVLTSAITGVFTLVSITISINQLVLSRIIGSPERTQERMDSVRQFRTDVAGRVERVPVSPTEPAAFLELVTRELREQTEELRDVYRDHHDPDLNRDVDHLVEVLLSLTQSVDDELSADSLPLLDVLSPILNNSYSSHINTVRRIRETTDDLSTAERRALDDLGEALRQINVTRHYFKTLYLHIELANISRQMLITGFPAIVVAIAVILLYGNGPVPLDDTLLLLTISAAISAILVPLAVLFAYGLRVATIAKRTTTFGTFTPVDEMP